MRRINEFIIIFYSAIFIILLSSCGQNQIVINHIRTNDLNLAINSTVAFISDRTSTEPNQSARIYCSGFFISDRIILSALHCFQDILTIRLMSGEIVQLPTTTNPTGRQFQFVYSNQIEQTTLAFISEEINEASVVAFDQESDLVILELTPATRSSFAYLHIAPQDPLLAETVYVIGHPRELAWSISNGIISRILSNRTIIQTNISLIGGYSGGPLINIRGEVVGLADAYIRNVPNVSFFAARQTIENFLQDNNLHESK